MSAWQWVAVALIALAAAVIWLKAGDNRIRNAVATLSSAGETQAIQDAPDPVQAAVDQLSDAWISGAVEEMWALPTCDALDNQSLEFVEPEETS